MGDALSRPARPVAARIFALVDRLYRRWHRLERVGELFYAGRSTWRGAPRRLSDGTEIASGDAILKLHFDSERAATAGAGGGSAAAVGMRFARLFVPSCRELARRVRDDPGWREIVAVHGVSWISPYVAEPWGFEGERLPAGWRTSFLRWHLGNLAAVADEADHRRRRQRPWPVEMWISRRRLCERFLDEAGRR